MLNQLLHVSLVKPSQVFFLLSSLFLSLSSPPPPGLNDRVGCEVIEVNENQIICGCTHLTAFSALFVPGGGGECGEWEWGTLQTVAAVLISVVSVGVVVGLVLEYVLVFKKRKERIAKKTKRRSTTGGSRKS